jgi:hypothetical protein
MISRQRDLTGNSSVYIIQFQRRGVTSSTETNEPSGIFRRSSNSSLSAFPGGDPQLTDLEGAGNRSAAGPWFGGRSCFYFRGLAQ